MAAQPITTHVPKAALSLPEPIVQSQENVQTQHHIPIPLPQQSTSRSYMHYTVNRS